MLMVRLDQGLGAPSRISDLYGVCGAVCVAKLGAVVAERDGASQCTTR
jgi:hypothetical protein